MNGACSSCSFTRYMFDRTPLKLQPKAMPDHTATKAEVRIAPRSRIEMPDPASVTLRVGGWSRHSPKPVEPTNTHKPCNETEGVRGQSQWCGGPRDLRPNSRHGLDLSRSAAPLATPALRRTRFSTGSRRIATFPTVSTGLEGCPADFPVSPHPPPKCPDRRGEGVRAEGGGGRGGGRAGGLHPTARGGVALGDAGVPAELTTIGASVALPLPTGRGGDSREKAPSGSGACRVAGLGRGPTGGIGIDAGPLRPRHHHR